MTFCIKEYYFFDLKATWKILYKSVCKQKEFIILKSLHVIILVYTFISLLFYKFLVKVRKRSKCIFMDIMMCFRKIVILDFAQLFKKRDTFLYPPVKKQDLNKLLIVIAA